MTSIRSANYIEVTFPFPCHRHIHTPYIQSRVLPVNYPSSFFTQLLLLPTRTCLVAYKQAQPNLPIAFISAVTRHPASNFAMNLSPDSLRIFDLKKPFLEILTLGVLPAYQHCGLARRRYWQFSSALRRTGVLSLWYFGLCNCIGFKHLRVEILRVYGNVYFFRCY